LTSLLTDVSSEMIASALPLYLVLHLGMSPFGFGLVDGLQHGVGALLRLASGGLSDRLGRHKRVAAAGYAASAACRLLMLPAGGNLTALLALVGADRVGKGVRTAPRDALISLAAAPDALGVAFGLHRAMDAAGAMLGPLVAFALLAWRPGGFEALFVVSFLVAVAGLGALLLLVRDAPAVPARPSRRWLDPLASAGRNPAVRRLAAAAALLGVASVSDGFLYLVLQRRSGIAATNIPLLFVGTSACYGLLAAPLGRLADRIGRRRLFLAGHALLLAAYATASTAGSGWSAPLLGVALLGAYYAATDGVLMALTAAHLPAEGRASGLALVSTAASLGRFAGSVLFGMAWSAWSPNVALGLFAALLVAALALTAGLLRKESIS
jgi:MFS family permease